MPVPARLSRGATRPLVAIGACCMLFSGNGAGQAVACSPRDKQAIWQSLPPTPVLPQPEDQGYALVGTASIWYGQYGLRNSGTPVLLLHGGLASSRYYGYLIPLLLQQGYHVIAMDTRGHGRSTLGSETISYHLLAMDVVGLLDHLRVSHVDAVGWSDGGILAIDLAMTHPQRLSRLFVFGADANYKGLRPDYWDRGAFALYMKRVKAEQEQITRRPRAYDALVKAFQHAWDTQPELSAQDLGRLRLPITVADGQYDEVMQPEHQVWMYQSIPAANLVILPNVSHFALLQCPSDFNSAVLDFLRYR